MSAEQLRRKNKILRGRCNKLHQQVVGLIDKATGNLDGVDIDIAEERENALRWERAAAVWEQQYYEMEVERNHWKSNHNSQVRLKRKFRPIVDAAIEWDKWKRINAEQTNDYHAEEPEATLSTAIHELITTQEDPA